MGAGAGLGQRGVRQKSGNSGLEQGLAGVEKAIGQEEGRLVGRGRRRRGDEGSKGELDAVVWLRPARQAGGREVGHATATKTRCAV